MPPTEVLVEEEMFPFGHAWTTTTNQNIHLAKEPIRLLRFIPGIHLLAVLPDIIMLKGLPDIHIHRGLLDIHLRDRVLPPHMNLLQQNMHPLHQHTHPELDHLPHLGNDNTRPEPIRDLMVCTFPLILVHLI